MVVIKIEDNQKIKKLDIKMEGKNTTKLETSLVNIISKDIIDKLISKE